jgi:hypothetical protein
MKLAMSLALAVIFSAAPIGEPYSSLTSTERATLKPQVERWIHDQVKHEWSDMWEIQDQTPELKNELLLGRKDAPDMDRSQYAQAMQGTVGVGIPEIKSFTLREIRKQNGGFWILGCGKLQREEWKQTSITDVHAKIVNGKVLFGLAGGTPDRCKL